MPTEMPTEMPERISNDDTAYSEQAAGPNARAGLQVFKQWAAGGRPGLTQEDGSVLVAFALRRHGMDQPAFCWRSREKGAGAYFPEDFERVEGAVAHSLGHWGPLRFSEQFVLRWLEEERPLLRRLGVDVQMHAKPRSGVWNLASGVVRRVRWQPDRTQPGPVWQQAPGIPQLWVDGDSRPTVRAIRRSQFPEWEVGGGLSI